MIKLGVADVKKRHFCLWFLVFQLTAVVLTEFSTIYYMYILYYVYRHKINRIDRRFVKWTIVIWNINLVRSFVARRIPIVRFRDLKFFLQFSIKMRKYQSSTMSIFNNSAEDFDVSSNRQNVVNNVKILIT